MGDDAMRVAPFEIEWARHTLPGILVGFCAVAYVVTSDGVFRKFACCSEHNARLPMSEC